MKKKTYVLALCLPLFSCIYETEDDPPIRPKMVLSFCANLDKVCEYHFGDVSIDAVRQGSFNIYSRGDVSLLVFDIDKIEGLDGVFKISDISDTMVEPGEEIVVGVSFTPNSTGYKTSKYLLITDATNCSPDGVEIVFDGIGTD